MHIDERLTISQLADLVGKSESFISHFFKEEFGKSPTQYILEKKDENCKVLASRRR